MKIPEDFQAMYTECMMRSERDVVTLRPALLQELIERIATLTEQLHKCAVATRSYEEAVAIGEPFGDEVKAVLTLRQNADAGFAELAQARAEIEQLGKVLEEVTKQRDDNEDYLAEMYMAGTGLEAEWSNLFGPEEAIENVKSERDALRAQLEQMCRPKTVEERVTITLQEGDFPYVVSVDGKKISAFGYEHSRDGSGAADFRLGLIAKLKAEGTVSGEAGGNAQ